MSLEIYKKGQGKVARVSAYILLGLLILFGAYRLHATFNVPGEGVLVEKLPVIGDLFSVWFKSNKRIWRLKGLPLSIFILADSMNS